MSCREEVLQGNFHSITDDRVVVTVNRVRTAARQRVQKLVSWIIRAFVSEGEEVGIDGNLDPAQHLSFLCKQNRTINVAFGRVAKEKTVSETKAKFLSMLLLE